MGCVLAGMLTMLNRPLPHIILNFCTTTTPYLSGRKPFVRLYYLISIKTLTFGPRRSSIPVFDLCAPSGTISRILLKWACLGPSALHDLVTTC